MYTREEAEGRRLKNPFDTITEGIGINRLTTNFLMAKLDGGFRGTDKEAVEMSRYCSFFICFHIHVSESTYKDFVKVAIDSFLSFMFPGFFLRMMGSLLEAPRL